MGSGSAGAAFSQFHAESRGADGSRQGLAGNVAETGGGRGDAKPDKSRTGLPASFTRTGMTDEKEGHEGLLRTMAKPPRGGQIKSAGITPQLQENGGESSCFECFLGNPERIFKLWSMSQEKLLRGLVEEMFKPQRIRETCFEKDLIKPHPQDQPRVAQGLAARSCSQGKRKTAHSAAVPALPAGNIHQCRLLVPQGDIKCFRSGIDRQTGTAIATQHRATALRVRLQLFRQLPFNLGYLLTQGIKGALRHDIRCHAVHSGLFVPVMFLSIPEGRQRVKKDFIPLWEKLPLLVGEGDKTASRKFGAKPLYGPSTGLVMARIYQTRAWYNQLSPSVSEMELMALETYANLPQDFRDLTGEIVIQIAEFPSEEIMDDLALETPFDLLGLFEGRGIAERWNPATGEGPNRITLFRRAILDYWAENEETLGDIIAHVLIHEIGHHFGLSDDDMATIEENVA